MKRKNKPSKSIIILALVLEITTLISCGKVEQTLPDENKGNIDYRSGFETPVTIRIPVYERGFEGWDATDNYYTDWIQTEFGDKHNIKIEFVAINRTTQVYDYMQLMASGKAPDIIFHYDMPQMIAYYSEGSLQQLDWEEIARYAPTYWTNIGEVIQTYGDVENDHYFFFAERPDAYNSVTVIRKDWLDAVGKKMPASLEELNEALAAWKEAGLGNGGGCIQQNAFIFDYPFRSLEMSEEEHALYSDLSIAPFTWQPAHDYLKNLNYQYNHYLIDREFYLNTDDLATQADFVSGAAGIYSFHMSDNTTVFRNLLENNPTAEVAYLPLKAMTPAGNAPHSREYWPFGLIMGLRYSTTDEERAAIWMYLEWMSQPENLYYLQNGVEGENYTMNELGHAIRNSDYNGKYRLSNNSNKDYWCLVTESVQYGDSELNDQVNPNNLASKEYEQIITDSYQDFCDNEKYRKPDVMFQVVISAVAEYKSELNEKWKELYVRCVMASEEEFESVYEAASIEYLEAGYQKILDEKQAAIDAGKGLN